MKKIRRSIALLVLTAMLLGMSPAAALEGQTESGTESVVLTGSESGADAGQQEDGLPEQNVYAQDAEVAEDAAGPDNAGAFAGSAGYHMTLDSEGVIRGGDWSDSSLPGSCEEAKSVYSQQVGAYVQFQPAAIEAGWYTVSFYYIAKEQNTLKMSAEILASSETKVVQPTAPVSDGWVDLGVFPFAGDGSEYLRLTIAQAGTWSRVADVRFVPSEAPEGPGEEPPKEPEPPVGGGETGAILYDNDFSQLPTELQGVPGWGLVELADGKALQGTSPAGAGLLAQLTPTLPETYTIVVDMAIMEAVGSNGYSAGLTFCHTDSSNFYHYRVDCGTKTNAQLYQWDRGTVNKTITPDFPMALTLGEAKRLRVTVDGETIRCYMDGAQTQTYTASASGGCAGLRVYNARTLFDNFVMYSGAVPPPEGGERAQGFTFPVPDGVVYTTRDSDVYGETSGAWSDYSTVDMGTVRRAQDGGTANFSFYPPEEGTRNYAIDWYLPANDGAKADFTVNTQDGMWKYSLSANKEAGWHRLGVVAATSGTAFTIQAASAELLYAGAVKITPTEARPDPVYTPTGGGSEEIAVLVNQLGYDTGKSKRATVPNAVDGTPFQVVDERTGAVAFSGVVMEGIADFSGLDTETDTDYYIVCAGARSYSFTIGRDLIQRRSAANALAFMNETRSDTFEWGRAGIAWRDSHQFSFELNGLVLQYMANPSLYDNLPYGIVHADTCEYEALRTQDEPDILWLIQFAALRYYDWGHNEGKKLHMLTKEQLAYYLYLYPEIRAYVPEETYLAIRDYTISVWGDSTCNVEWYGVSGSDHNLYSVQKLFGGLKGSQPPGHSIVPNLLMYEVARRDGLGDDVAERFFQAAYDNCLYTIQELDITDPNFNKGQRMSEYITVPALCWFLEMYPDRAPAGLKAALEAWAEKTIARSNNMWDIRMAASMEAGDGAYSFPNKGTPIDKDYWTGAAYALADGQNPAPKNEPGNQAGLQAVTYAAARVLDQEANTARLRELGVAAIDDLFGRNPTGRAAFYHFTRDFEGADLGWYTQYKGGNGVLGGCTAVIDANAPELCYPYAPENYNTGYTEGWVAYNTAWNASLAYAAADSVALTVSGSSGSVGGTVTVTLTAPANLNAAAVETASVKVTDVLTGAQTALTLRETAPDSSVFSGVYRLPNTAAVEISYGAGLFRQARTITVSDFTSTPLTSVSVTPDALALGVGETAVLTAVVLPEDANDRRLTWRSDNPAVAEVQDGRVTAVGLGEADIHAVGWDRTEGVCHVTVTAARAIGLRVSAPDALSLFDGAGTAAVTGVIYSGGSVETENLPQVRFRSSAPDILSVDEGTGVLHPLSAGCAEITAETLDRSLSGTAEVTVTGEKTFDLLAIKRSNGAAAAGGASVTEVSDNSINQTRVKLTGGQVGGSASFALGTAPAGDYEVALNSKYYGGQYAYGQWSFQVNGAAVGSVINFNDPERNGGYHDISLGRITLTGSGPVTFTFVSADGGTLVPVSVTLRRFTGEEPGPGPEVEPGQTEPKIHSLDEMYRKVYTDTSIQRNGLHYRLYVPAGYTHEQTEELPLLIYLNGAGSRGTDNDTQLKNLSPLLVPLIDSEKYPCMIAVPQLPVSDKWVNVDWTKGSYSKDVPESNSAKLLVGLIGELKQAYRIDEERVYLMGQSFGGYGTWDLITRHRELFAAAIPMCGAGCLERAEAIQDLPLLVLHGAADPTVPVSGSREMTEALRKAGSNSVTYLEYPGDDHYIQRRIFEQPELYLNWLFRQEKGSEPHAADISGCYFPELTLNMNQTGQQERLNVVSGTTSISNEKLTLKPANASSTALALVKDTGDFADGMLTVHVENGSINGGGLVLRAQDDKTYLHVRFNNAGGNNLEIMEMVNGASISKRTAPHRVTDSRISCLRVELQGSQVRAWVNNRLILSYTIQSEALKTSGAVGLRAYGTDLTVDDLIWSVRQGGSTITLTSMADRQVYQRDAAAGVGRVPLTGRAVGAAALEVRVTAWDGGAIILDQQEIPLLEDGSFHTELTVPQGGWYRTELTARDTGGAEIARLQSGRWGVGINILCIGQSNMAGQGKGDYVIAGDRVSNFMNETWSHLEDPYAKGDTSISKNNACGGSMVPTIGNILTEAYHVPVGFVPAALSGANLLTDSGGYPYWLKRNEENPADRSTLYGNSLYRAQMAGGIEFIIMNQGENNVSTKTSQADYASGMRQLLANYQRDLGWDVPLIYCQLGPAKASSWNDSHGEFISGIRSAQLEVDNGTDLILGAVELDLVRNADNLHYTSQSQQVIGQRMANAIRYLLGDASTYRGPSISGARFQDDSRTVIDVSVAHTGGTDISPAAGITGFEVLDGEAPVEVLSAVRKDAHTITITLARRIEGEGRLCYMRGLLPDVSGLVKDNSPLALPLNVTPGWLTVEEFGNPVDLSELADLLRQAEQLEETGYTEETWAALLRAKREAQILLDGTDVGQEEVDRAVTMLRQALSTLIAAVPDGPGEIYFPNIYIPAVPASPPVKDPSTNISEPDTPLTGQRSFEDVTKDNWFYMAVHDVVQRGIMTGVSETRFDPDGLLTRGMVVTILYRMEGEPAYQVPAFSDVAEGEYYTSAIAWAADREIINGYGDGRFGPDDSVTREQLAVILYRYAETKGILAVPGADLSPFTDAGEISGYAVEAVRWANALNLISGVTSEELQPTGRTTRAQVAMIFHRLLLLAWEPAE